MKDNDKKRKINTLLLSWKIPFLNAKTNTINIQYNKLIMQE